MTPQNAPGGATPSGGTYTLVVSLPRETTVTVGALGDRELAAGWYAYTGSALGTGGFSRVDRHVALAAGENDTRHWHVDYLLGETSARVDTVVRTSGVDAECAVARALDAAFEGVRAFGASDCDCPSHLHYDADRDRLVGAVRDAHDAALKG